MSLAGHHPCNRRSWSSPDEAPDHNPANVRLWLPKSPELPLPSCSARWHHRRNVQTASVDTVSPSTGQRHNAETDWLTGGWRLHLAACPSHAGPTGRLLLALALATSARCRALSIAPWRVSSPPVAADLAGCCRR